MKLNADIIHDYLMGDLNIEVKGRKSPRLHLERPLFYLGRGEAFAENQLYVVRGDKLPASAQVKPGAVLMVVGPCHQLAFYTNRCTVLHVTGSADVFSVFNQVQQLFDRFDGLEGKLEGILHSTASVASIVDAAARFLETPVLVLDPSFSVLASNQFDTEGDLDISLLGTFLSSQKLAMQEREPMAMTILDKSLLCKNLYSNDEYLGSITLDYCCRRRRESDLPLLNYLAKVIVAALRRLPAVRGSQTNQVRAILSDLVDCISVGSSARSRLPRRRASRRYVCVKIVLSSNLASIPHSYLCNRLESAFPESMAFVHIDAVVGALVLDEFEGEGGEERFRERLEEFVETVEASAGISNAFDDLEDIRFYYDQAAAALSAGQLYGQSLPCFFFKDYALVKLITNAFGEFPLEMYYPAGMRRLVEHDRENSVSYVETLRVYLQNNLSVTRTAQALFIHRSTLLDRIARIERELEADLRNPDDRLLLEILLKGRYVLGRLED